MYVCMNELVHIYVCMYVCMYVCIACVCMYEYASMYTLMSGGPMHVCMYVCMYV